MSALILRSIDSLRVVKSPISHQGEGTEKACHKSFGLCIKAGGLKNSILGMQIIKNCLFLQTETMKKWKKETMYLHID